MLLVWPQLVITLSIVGCSVLQSAFLSVCLWAYLKNLKCILRWIFYACCLWLWLGPLQYVIFGHFWLMSCLHIMANHRWQKFVCLKWLTWGWQQCGWNLMSVVALLLRVLLSIMLVFVCLVGSSQSTRSSTVTSGATCSSSHAWLQPTSPTMTRMALVCPRLFALYCIASCTTSWPLSQSKQCQSTFPVIYAKCWPIFRIHLHSG